MADSTRFSICSYNCRGYNLTKKQYVENLLLRSSVLFLQEHWLSENQCALFDELSSKCSYYAVSGFSNNEVLLGRPFGGCAIIWKDEIITNMKRVVVDSRRIIAASCEISSVKLLLINVYLPCDMNDSINSDAFLHEISLCETILDNYHDHEIILGGDFNVDFNGNFNNTTLLSGFCKRCNLVSADFHTDSSIDFTFNFNNERFSIIDHFIVSESLFKFSIDSVCVIHEVDNLSDHEPLFGLFQFSNEPVSVSTARHYSKCFSWYKATKQNICDFQICVSTELSNINLPIEALSCCNINCNNVNHNNALSKYCEDIYKCCYNAGCAAILTRVRFIMEWK